MLTYEQNVKAVLECIFAGYKDELIEDACKMICALKCFEKQEQKPGHWIYDGRNKICSECNFKIDTWHDTDIGGKRLNYCLKCGVKMEVEK